MSNFEWPTGEPWERFAGWLKETEEYGIPFGWMVRDVRAAIEYEANFLAALGLLCYTEICGRKALSFEGKPKRSNAECFEYFYREYMGCGPALDKYPQLYEIVRNGLAHEYMVHGVELFSVEVGSSVPDVEAYGLYFKPEPKRVAIVLMPYFRQFVYGLRKLYPKFLRTLEAYKA